MAKRAAQVRTRRGRAARRQAAGASPAGASPARSPGIEPTRGELGTQGELGLTRRTAV